MRQWSRHGGHFRLIGSIRREYLDHLFFWNKRDLENKLEKFKNYYNVERAHSSLERKTPIKVNEEIAA